MRQYLRKVRATFTGEGGELVVEELKIAFDVEKSISASQNTGTVKIWNLSKENRGKIKKEMDRVRLEAGYEGSPGSKGNIGIILDANIRDVKHHREKEDIVTVVECGDGDKGLREGTISLTFKKGTKPKEMIEQIQKNMPEIKRGEWKGLDNLPAYDRPVVMCGSCKRELDKIGRSHNLHWSVQDSALEIIPGDGYIDDVVVISAQTGMIGVPSITDKGVDVDCLLNPKLGCGRVVEIRSEELDMNDKGGRYRIAKLKFSGDNKEGDFLASITGERISDGRVG